MKVSALILTVIFPIASLFSQSEFEMVITNQVHISGIKSKIFYKSSHIFEGQTRILKNSLDFNCEPTSEILGRLGDSIFLYNLDNQSYNFIAERVPGIFAGFGLLNHNESILVSAADWDSVYYFKDSKWQYSGYNAGSDGDLIAASCGTNSTYFIGTNLWFFNGNSNPILIRENINYTSADLAVDENENAWVLTGSNWPISDTLRVIDSTGVSICDIPFKEPINTINAYGMAIKDEKIVVGFGSSNPNFPNSLVPLEIDSTTNVVQFGDPIATNVNISGDLASCMKNMEIPNCNLINSISTEYGGSVEIFPNPFISTLRIQSSQSIIERVTLFDSFGRNLKSINTKNYFLDLDLHDLSNAVYSVVIKLKDSDKPINKMIVKYH